MAFRQSVVVHLPSGSYVAEFGNRFGLDELAVPDAEVRFANSILLQQLRRGDPDTVAFAEQVATRGYGPPCRTRDDLLRAVESALRSRCIRWVGEVPVQVRVRQRLEPVYVPEPQPVVEEQPEVAWIEIRLVDDLGQPVPSEPFEITLPDGIVREGTLDDSGRARLNYIPAGSCQVTFPRLDGGAWDTA